MSDLQQPAKNTDSPSDLPQRVVKLARMIARDFSAPGEYMLRLTVPPYPDGELGIETSRVNVIRDTEADRRPPLDTRP